MPTLNIDINGKRIVVVIPDEERACCEHIFNGGDPVVTTAQIGNQSGRFPVDLCERCAVVSDAK